jgi:hypothetical protein
LFGPVFFIGMITEDSRSLSKWVMEWLELNHLYAGPAVYACTNMELAADSLQKPLDHGQAPSLIIVDHNLNCPDISAFCAGIRNALPESWVIELVDHQSTIPYDQSAFTLLKPLKKGDWDDILAHIYLKANSPQWSRALD